MAYSAEEMRLAELNGSLVAIVPEGKEGVFFSFDMDTGELREALLCVTQETFDAMSGPTLDAD